VLLNVRKYFLELILVFEEIREREIKLLGLTDG
jgi:hypothetical protein